MTFSSYLGKKRQHWQTFTTYKYHLIQTNFQSLDSPLKKKSCDLDGLHFSISPESNSIDTAIHVHCLTDVNFLKTLVIIYPFVYSIDHDEAHLAQHCNVSDLRYIHNHTNIITKMYKLYSQLNHGCKK